MTLGMERARRRLVTVGDRAGGKTSLLIVFTRGQFPTVYTPKVMEDWIVSIEVKGEPLELELLDTAAVGVFEDHHRSQVHPYANAFLICFSIEQPDSLDNVAKKWNSEVIHFSDKRIPRFLVGCKKDLRYDQEAIRKMATYGQAPVTSEQGEEMARSIGARYFECSAKTGEGVRELFRQVTEAVGADLRVGACFTASLGSRSSGNGCIVA